MKEKSEPLLPARLASRRGFLLAAGGASLWFLWPRELRAGGADAARPFLGSYRYAGDTRERAAREQAVEDAVAELNFLVRSLARSRLKSATPISATLRIAADTSSLTVANDNRLYTAPLDGRSVKSTGITGDPIELRYRISEGRIVQTFDGDGGGRANTFVLAGEQLVMQVRIYSHRLPKDVRYKLTFARV
jgi:hypothetical protein